ncbi:hypothetical protein [Desulfatibacillum aliphaticivorans]|uniref:hypothetical protein n=1 Tax=Desulfatibacillum aliphaticivorans TaxID=218208 RepID=UPI000426752D|nr:hypothetical protein [Desulfatibacillum aliphaticivorans]
MNGDHRTHLPSYLKDLVQPTPSSVVKFLAAWDNLCVETQIKLLTTIEEISFPDYLSKRILSKSLDSPNSYIRYLSAKQIVHLNHEDEEVKELILKIESDPDPLVKYSPLESEWCWQIPSEDKAEEFFDLPQEARLSTVRQSKNGGKWIAYLITYGINKLLPKSKITNLELTEILTDYLMNPNFSTYYGTKPFNDYDGFSEFDKGEDIVTLWELTRIAPKEISWVLIANLPENSGLKSEIPESTLNRLNPWQLEQLLFRKDIKLRDFRKKIFLQTAKKGDSARCAAISYNFDLSYEEFAQVLSLPEAEKVGILSDLALYAGDLSLVIYDALSDCLRRSKVFDNIKWARMNFQRKAESLSGWRRREEIKELQLYRLAIQAAPWKVKKQGHPPEGELGFLSTGIIKGNTWRTFLNFSDEWEKKGNKKLENIFQKFLKLMMLMPRKMILKKLMPSRLRWIPCRQN